MFVVGLVFGPFYLHEFGLLVLFGVEFAVELAALVADAVFVDQGTGDVEDVDHFLTAVVQVVFDLAEGGVEDMANLFDFEAVDIFEDEGDLLLDGEHVGDTGEAVVDVFFDFVDALGGVVVGVVDAFHEGGVVAGGRADLVEGVG